MVQNRLYDFDVISKRYKRNKHLKITKYSYFVHFNRNQINIKS